MGKQLREVRGGVKLSSSIKTIETNGVTKKIGKDGKMGYKSIGFCENIEGLEICVVKKRVFIKRGTDLWV